MASQAPTPQASSSKPLPSGPQHKHGHHPKAYEHLPVAVAVFDPAKGALEIVDVRLRDIPITPTSYRKCGTLRSPSPPRSKAYFRTKQTARKSVVPTPLMPIRLHRLYPCEAALEALCKSSLEGDGRHMIDHGSKSYRFYVADGPAATGFAVRIVGGDVDPETHDTGRCEVVECFNRGPPCQRPESSPLIRGVVVIVRFVEVEEPGDCWKSWCVDVDPNSADFPRIEIDRADFVGEADAGVVLSNLREKMGRMVEKVDELQKRVESKEAKMKRLEERLREAECQESAKVKRLEERLREAEERAYRADEEQRVAEKARKNALSALTWAKEAITSRGSLQWESPKRKFSWLSD